MLTYLGQGEQREVELARLLAVQTVGEWQWREGGRGEEKGLSN